LVADEVLRSRIRKIIDEPVQPSLWARFSKNPLASLLIGFALTGLIGAWLTNRYNEKQKEIEFIRQIEQRNLEHERDKHEKELEAQKAEYQRTLELERDDHQKLLEFQRNAQQRELEQERSFANELNKTRVAKIAEVWEELNLFEATTIKNIMDKHRVDFDDANIRYKKIIDLIYKNRFWLGEEQYSEMVSYCTAYINNLGAIESVLKSIRESIDKVEIKFDDKVGLKGRTNLSQLRTDLVKIRSKLLKELYPKTAAPNNSLNPTPR
jgi:hypothetical protein